MATGPGGFSVGRVSIQVVPDTSKFRQQLTKELKQATKGIKVEIPVDLDAGRALLQMRALDRTLSRLENRNINIGANVSGNGNDFARVADNLQDIAKKASNASDGFSRMSRTGAIVLAVVVLLAPALAAISTLIAGLPSLMFAFSFAALAVGLGFDGIKKAASGFAPTIDRLKKSLSGTFQKNLTQPFKDLNKLAPVLDTGLNKIAVSLSGIISNLIGLVTSVRGMEQINTILSGTAKFFDDLTPAINMGMQALLRLGEVGAKNFGLLNDTFTKFSRNFLDAVNRMSDNGSLSAAFVGLNKVLSSLLEGFTQLFESGITAMGVLGGPLSVLIDSLIGAFVKLMPFLTEISNLFSVVLGEALTQLGPILDALRPGFTALARALGTLLTGALKAVAPILTAVATILSDVVLKVITALEPHFPTFIAFFTELGNLLGQFLLAAFEAISPFLDQLLKFFVDVLTAIKPLLPVLLRFIDTGLASLARILQDIGPSLVEVGQTAFPQILQIVKDLVPIFIDFLKAVEPLLPKLAELAAILLDVAVPAMKEIYNTVKEVWPEIKQIVESALKHIEGVMDIVLGALEGDWDRVWEGVKKIASAAWDGIKAAVKLGIDAVIQFFVDLPFRIVSALVGLPQDLVESGRAAIRGFADGIKQAGRDAINAAKGVLAELRGLFPFSPAKYGPFSGSGYTDVSGRHLMEDWAKGIQDGAPVAVRAVEEAMAASHAALDVQAAVTSEGFGGIGQQVAHAIEGMEIKADGTNIARVVNKVNNMDRRR